MGGKSRKSGGVSKKLIDRLVRERKAQKKGCDTKPKIGPLFKGFGEDKNEDSDVSSKSK